MLWVIHSSCDLHESPGKTPYWQPVNSLFGIDSYKGRYKLIFQTLEEG